MSKNKAWKPVTPNNPCPICGKPSWCGRCNDVVRCMREDTAPKGWSRIKDVDDDGGTVFRKSKSERSTDAAPVNVDPKWSRLARTYVKKITERQLKKLAKALGVSPRALKKIGMGWSATKGAYTFPQFNADGFVTGISLRFADGAK